MTEEANPKEIILTVQSGMNQAGRPFVQFLKNKALIGQFTPDEARSYASQLIEAAEAAEQDAFIFDWVTRRIGAGPEQAVGLLQDFRIYRRERTGKTGGPVDKEDWAVPEEPAPPGPGPVKERP